MTTHPPSPVNWSWNQNKKAGAETRAGKASRRRKFTLVTIPAVIKNMERAATSKRTSARIRGSVHFTALGWAARKSLLALTNSLDITARTRARSDMSVGYAASASWGAIIFQSTQKHTDWSPAKNWTDPRIQCSFESKRVGWAFEKTARLTCLSSPTPARGLACNVDCSDWLLGQFLCESCAVANRIRRGHFAKSKIEHENLLLQLVGS